MIIFKKIFKIIFSISVIYCLFVLSFYLVLYTNKNFLIDLFNKFDVYKNLPFTLKDTDIEKIAYELMDFLIGKSKILNTKIYVNGILKELYSSKAKIHMLDVRNIFLANIHFSIYMSFISLLILTYHSYINELFELKKTFLYTICIFFIITLIIVIYCLIDFNSFFLLFHKLLFTNDYYLFDPATDIIILMLPEELFFYIGRNVLICFIFLVLIFFVFLHLLSKIQSHLEATHSP